MLKSEIRAAHEGDKGPYEGETRESLHFCRRHFLRRLGVACAVPLIGCDELDNASNPAKPRQFVIVGAGLAGLCAAYELERRGHTVTLLEAEANHIGGRVRTLRFEDGLYGEAGAMRIPRCHSLTRHYIKLFGLPLRTFVQDNPEAYYYVRRHRVRVKEVRRLNGLYGLRDSERQKAPDDLWADVVLRRLEGLTDRERMDLSSDILKTDAVRALDQLSLQQLFETEGLSPEAIEFLASTYDIQAFLSGAATEHLLQERDKVWTEEFSEIVGGMDRLPAAFAARLRSRARLGCEVVRLEQDFQRRRAAAIYLERGRLQRAEGDFLLCTLPFPVLRRLQIEPEFSRAKQRAIRELNYDSATKVLAVCTTRFWESEDGIFGGGTHTDLPTGSTYYPSDNAQKRDERVSLGSGVMLASYTFGTAARRLGSLQAMERSDLVMRHLSCVHPQLRKERMLRRTASWSWDNYKWCGGAFAWFKPGQHSALHRDILTPEGRIFLAGEHTSLAHTWMQGALESSVRAVREMLAVAQSA